MTAIVIATPQPVSPVSERFIGLARETTYGTPVNPSVTIPLTSFLPQDKPVWIMDEAWRASMAGEYDMLQGPLWAETAFAGPVYGDTIGHLLYNILGDYTQSATSTAPVSTLSAAIAAGVSTIPVASGGASFTNGMYAIVYQAGSTGPAEIVEVTSGSTSTTVVLQTATPTRFAHSSGATISNTNVSGSTYTNTFSLLNSAQGQGNGQQSGQPPSHCVDTETEILTADGWKTYNLLHAGDEVLTYNHETGMSEWQECLEVVTFPAQERDMISMEGRGHSSLTTPNHRWPVVTPYRSWVTGEQKRTWRTSETLKAGDRIPTGALCADLPSDPKYTDAFVELVAWFWTEGDMNGNSRSNVRITQSSGNASNVARIDAALRTLYGAPEPSDRPLVPDGLPHWRSKPERDLRGHPDKIRFYLNSIIGSELIGVAPNRVVSRDFIRSLTKAQLDLFILVSMLADNNGVKRLSQVSRERSESFMFAAILAGCATSMIKKTWDVERWPHNQNPQWCVTMKSTSWITPYNSAKLAGQTGGGWSISRVKHKGVIWCPRTPNQTWMARRGGQCYFTGNTFTDRTQVPGAGANLAAQYAFGCLSQLTLTGSAQGIFMHSGNLTSFSYAQPSAAPTANVSGVRATPNWRSTVGINGTVSGSPVNDLTEWEFALNRVVEPIPTTDGTQSPYTIARGKFTATAKLTYQPSVDLTALTYMLNNTQPQLQIVYSNGLSGTSNITYTINVNLGAFDTANINESSALFGYDVTAKLIANTTNVGWSGGYSPISVAINNSVAVY